MRPEQIQTPPSPPAVVAVIGPSGSGKTSLIEDLVATLTREQGLKVGYLKTTAHSLQSDHEGKDTWRIRRAGAGASAVVSRSGSAS